MGHVDEKTACLDYRDVIVTISPPSVAKPSIVSIVATPVSSFKLGNSGYFYKFV